MVKYLSYNTLASFGDTKRKDALVQFVKTESPDVAFFAEAYREDGDFSVVESSIKSLEKLGYAVTQGLTDLVDTRSDRTGFIGIVRPELGEGSCMPIGVRQGFLAKIKDPTSGEQIISGGVHLDDRTEEARLLQISALPANLDTLMGDFNAMHRSTPIAKALRLAYPITQTFPEVNPDFAVTTSLFKRMISMGQRLTRMADGRTLTALEEEHRLRDADSAMQPTIHGIAQLDHIVTSDRIKTSNYHVHRNIRLSDHVPISVELHTS